MNNSTTAQESPESQPPTAEQINRAISWYEAHIEEIAAVLPITVPGVQYQQGCLASLNRVISIWKSGTMPVNLAVCYIYRPIKVLYQELEKRRAVNRSTPRY